ncbi:MAG: hypothetical protein P8Y71_12235 [Pseudolabrys sp.]
MTTVSQWITPKILPAVEASTNEYGFSFIVAPTIKIIGDEPLKRMHAKWGKEVALFTRQTSGNKNYLRIRLPATAADVHIAHSKIILISSDRKLVASASYATFAPGK